jgi:hypothetical protein
MLAAVFKASEHCLHAGEELLKQHSSFIPAGEIRPDDLCLLDMDRLVAFASIVGLKGLKIKLPILLSFNLFNPSHFRCSALDETVD